MFEQSSKIEEVVEQISYEMQGQFG